MKSYTFCSNIKVESMHFLYLDNNHEQKVIQMETDDSIHWRINILSSISIKCYVFIVNELFWICDQKKETIKVDGYWYSNESSKLSTNNAMISNSFFCKDFNAEDYSPMGITDSFSNLDAIMGFWAEVKNASKDAMIYLQLIDPNNDLAVMTFEKLNVDTENRSTIYFGFQINQMLVPGIWKFRLIQNESVLFEKGCYYKIINNNYTNNKVYYSTPGVFDKKY